MQRELSEVRLKDADLVIAPRRNGTSFYDFHEAKKMIDLGERAAEVAMGRMQRLAAAGQSETVLSGGVPDGRRLSPGSGGRTRGRTPAGSDVTDTAQRTVTAGRQPGRP